MAVNKICRFRLFLSLALSLVCCGYGWAKDGWLELRPKPNDEVEYLRFDNWLPGRVLAVSKSEIKIEYEFANTTVSTTAKPEQLRYPWQAKAISPPRLWTDASGTFKVKGVIYAIDAEKGEITLYLWEDQREVTIAIKKLSDSDQKQIEKLLKSGSIVASRTDTEEFTLPTESTFQPWGSQNSLATIPADPPAIAIGVPMGGCIIPNVDRFSALKLVGLCPIGSAAGWMVAGTAAGTFHAQPSQLLWIKLTDGKIHKTHQLATGERLVAALPSASQVLTISQTDRSWYLGVWKASPKLDMATAVARWKSDGDQAVFARPWAEFISPTLVIHQWKRQGIVVWNITEKKAVYSVDLESFFGAQPVLSPGREYLALPEDKQLRVLDAASGKTLAVLPIEGGRCSAAAFDAKGEKLAVLTKNQLAVWKLGSSEPPNRYRADLVGTPFSTSMDWVDDQFILIGGDTLFDLTVALPVWSYKQEMAEVQRDDWGTKTISVADGRYCYSAIASRGVESVCVVGAVDLPGPGVRETLAKIDLNDLYLLKRGNAVQLKVNCGQFDTQVRESLTKIADKNGWLIDTSSEFILEATIGRAETQTVSFQNVMTGEKVGITVQPYTQTLVLRKKEETLWSAGGTSGIASHISVPNGESLQSRADAVNHPYPAFFEVVDVPTEIYNPRYKGGFGTSKIGVRGLEATPLEDLPLQ